MIFNVHAGHTPSGRPGCGAVGIIDESVENRKVKDLVISKLRALGHTVYDCTDDIGVSEGDNLAKIVAKCNAHKVDLDVSIHFNSFNGEAFGTEVWVYPNGKAEVAAKKVCAAIEELGFKNRGVKQSSGLYVLSQTTNVAMLIECCFVDSEKDTKLYNAEKMANAIVKGITGTTASVTPVTPTPAPTPAPKPTMPSIIYAVKTRSGWLPEVIDNEDYAGIENSHVVAFMAKMSDGTPLRYRAHCGGRWLGWISGYNKNDYYAGFAGDEYTAIDAIELKCDKYDIRYKVSTTYGGSYLATVTDNTVVGGDSYAGAFGMPIDKVMCWVNK